MLSWAKVIEQVSRVEARTGLDAVDLLSKVETKQVQIFPVKDDSLIVAGMDRHGRAHIYAAAGEMNALLEALPHVENWYAQRGALRITLTGRFGWKRVLKGYHERDGVLFKELN